MIITTASFIKNFLPGGVIPNRMSLDFDKADAPITVPFAVLSWDDGLDSWTEDDGTQVSVQDSPPGWFICAAFESREEADSFVASKSKPSDYMVSEGQTEPLYEFCYSRQR